MEQKKINTGAFAHQKEKNTLRIYGVDPAAPSTGYPLLLTHIPAGFPSPADDYAEQKLDLNEHLVRNPAATFFVRVEGNSMVDAGIHSGDILIVDRSVEVTNGAIVIAHIQGEFTVKRIERKDDGLYLLPASAAYSPLLITPEMEVEIWGVVIYVIHKTT